MNEERIDLSALDPARDPDRIERIVEGVRAGIELRIGEEPWTTGLGRAWIPALLAAAVAGVLAVAAPRLAGPTAVGADPLAVTIGVPAPLARWAAEEEPPSTAEVLATLETSSR
jgi:hypothetical protein